MSNAWLLRLSLAILASSIVAALPAPEPVPLPPDVPTASTARNELAFLTVAAQGPQDGYSREKFPHWITQYG